LRTSAQKRYAEKNAALLREKNLAYKAQPDVQARRAERDARNRNQRNSDLGWLWLSWSAHFRRRLTVDYGQLSIVNAEQLAAPRFVFIHRGKRSVDFAGLTKVVDRRTTGGHVD
jgi:hypothetical protein